MTRLAALATASLCALGCCWALGAQERDEKLPEAGTILINKDKAEVILSAVVQYPKGKPCIDDWGQRIQAFVGCSKAAGGDAKMAGYFVFLVDVPAEDVYK